MRQALRQPYQQFFGTLANQARLDIIEALRTKAMTVNEISDATGMEQSHVSHNLRRLIECGFVTARIEGREKTCALNDETIKPLLELMNNHMDNYCCKVVEAKAKRHAQKHAQDAEVNTCH